MGDAVTHITVYGACHDPELCELRARFSENYWSVDGAQTHEHREWVRQTLFGDKDTTNS